MSSRSLSKPILVVLCSMLLGTLGTRPVSAQVTYFVPDDFATIQLALDSAIDGDTILVAPGTYAENIDFNGKSVMLQSTDGPAATTIDGDNCTTGVLTCSVVRFTSGEGPDSIIDGFTITRGNGTSLGAGVVAGGGVFVFNSSPTIMNCWIEDNLARRGGGGFSGAGNSTWIACVFRDNVAVASSWGHGGGLHLVSSDAIVVDCSFESNTASDQGGGIFNYYGSSAITGCTFVGNAAAGGGGLSNFSEADPDIADCRFIRNTASIQGGGVWNDPGAGIVLTMADCEFIENEAPNGGGLSSYFSSVDLTNCLFSGNSATSSEGGGLYVLTSGTASRITNCTFFANTASAGGGIRNGASTPIMISNSIVWGNTPNAVVGAASASYSCFPTLFGGTGNITSDPQFVDPIGGDGIPGTVDDDLRLAATSPCLDQGTDSPAAGLPSTDLDGGLRIECAAVDMGPYEFDGCPVPFIRGDTNDDGLADLSDVVFNLEYQFSGGSSLCLDAHDVNDNGAVDISDAAFALIYLFAAGPPPTQPFPGCGYDPSADSLDCVDGSTCP